jgi:hypothetical protein
MGALSDRPGQGGRRRLRRRAPAVRWWPHISSPYAPCSPPSPPTPKSVYVPGPRAQYGVPAQGKECFSTGRASSATDQSRSLPNPGGLSQYLYLYVLYSSTVPVLTLCCCCLLLAAGIPTIIGSHA